MLNLIKQYTSAVTALITPNEIRNQFETRIKMIQLAKGRDRERDWGRDEKLLSSLVSDFHCDLHCKCRLDN